jgi:hypothetical protein
MVSDEFTTSLNTCLSCRSVRKFYFEVQFQNMTLAYTCILKYYVTKMTFRVRVIQNRAGIQGFSESLHEYEQRLADNVSYQHDKTYGRYMC